MTKRYPRSNSGNIEPPQTGNTTEENDQHELELVLEHHFVTISSPPSPDILQRRKILFLEDSQEDT
ncbi:hypothetical protein BGZ49_010231, partial [Haplosporangium sp. Z 27]